MNAEKYRNEIKYLISTREFEILKVNLPTIMERDPHTDERGSYHIRSIYYDDLYDTCLRENEAGISPRKKWRIRTYNLSKDVFLLECKSKVRDKIHKDACLLKESEFDMLLSGQPVWDDGSRPILNQFSLAIAENGMRPKVLVGYERIPYICANGNVRLTLDFNIYSSPDTDGILNHFIQKRPVLPNGQYLLEVKYDEYLPDYIRQAAQLNHMQRIAFSKYCLCRKYHL